MRKYILLFLIFAFIPFSVLSAQTMTDEELDVRIEEALGDTSFVREQVTSMVQHNFYVNEKVITDLSNILPVEERTNILDTCFMHKGLYVGLNLWPGLGVGSFQQKDFMSFAVLGLLDLAGYSAVIVGTGWAVVSFVATIFVAPLMSIGNTSTEAKNEAIAKLWRPPLIILGCGLGVEIISKTLGVIFASTYSSTFNRRLQRALLLEDVDSLSFAPVVDPINKEYGLMATVRL